MNACPRSAFAKDDFMPNVRARFADKPSTFRSEGQRTRGAQFPCRIARRSCSTCENLLRLPNGFFRLPPRVARLEQSTLVKRHSTACELGGIEALPFYRFRHTCLTRWALHMNPYTLAYVIWHSDFGTTRRY